MITTKAPLGISAAASSASSIGTGIFVCMGVAVPATILNFRALPLVLTACFVAAFLGLGSLDRIRLNADRMQVALAAGLAALAAISLAWTPDPARAGLTLFVGVMIFACAGAAHWSWPTELVLPRSAILLVASCLAAASLIIIVEMHDGMALHLWLSGKGNPSKMNQGALVLALWIWPFTFLMKNRVGARLAMGLWFVVAAGVLASFSHTARLGFSLATLAYVASRLRRPVSLFLLGSALATFLVIQPLLTGHAQMLLPDWLVNALQAGHAIERLQIWTSFSAVVPLHPVFGFGFDASGEIGFGPLVEALPPELKVGIQDSHPHDMYLQVWVELGAVGAILAAALIQRWGKLSDGLPDVLGPSALSCWIVAGVTALVGYGAWQAWWIAAVSTLPLLFRIAAGSAASPHARA